jgi:cbb3-type cytochrome oxidase maturation protein
MRRRWSERWSEPLVERRSWIWLFAILVLVLAGMGFIYKFTMFAKEALGAEAASFAVVPLAVYILVAMGFFSLFLWALSRGQFRDVEAPKRRMLEMEADYDRKGI